METKIFISSLKRLFISRASDGALGKMVGSGVVLLAWFWTDVGLVVASH